MTPFWLRAVRRRLARTPVAPARRPRLRAEELEDRSTPATITWTNAASGNWATASNWDLGRVPAAGDDVVVPDLGAAGASLTVTLNAAATVRSVTAAENFTLTGAAGVLTLSGGTQSISVGGAFTLNGTLKGGTIAAGTTAKLDGGDGTLDGATVAAGAAVEVSTSRSLIVLNGLTVDGTVELAATSSDLSFRGGDQTVGGSGVVRTLATGTGSTGGLVVGTANTTVTIGPDLTVRGGNIRAGSDAGLGVANGRIVNRGTILADGSGTLFLGGTTSTAAPGFTNAAGGRVRLTSATQTVRITATSWVNEGTIEVSAGTLLLGGAFTQAGLGTFVRTGGTVNLTGTIAGGLTLNDTLGSWNLSGGTLAGGTYSVAPGSTALLVGTAQGGTLDGVTINAPVDITRTSGSTVGMRGAVVLNSTVAVGSPARNSANGQVLFTADTTVTTTAPAGTAQFVLGYGSANTIIQANGVTATIGPNVTIRGRHGTVGNSLGRLINRGVIRRDVAGGIFDIQVGNGGRNEGVIEATVAGNTNVSTVVSNGVWTNAAGATITASAGTLSVGQPTENWTNQGTIAVSTAAGATPTTLKFAGQLTRAKIGTFSRDAGSTVQLGSTFVDGSTLTGGLTLTSADGEWLLASVAFLGGTLATTGTGRFVAAGPGTVLDGVTLNATIDTSRETGLALTVRNGLVLNVVQPLGSASAANATRVTFDGTQALGTAGGGAFVFGGASGNVITVSGTGAVLTITPGVTIRGGKGSVGGGTAGLVHNYGRIEATGPGGQITFNVAAGLTNFGTIRAADRGAVVFNGAVGSRWVNAPGGRIEAAGGAFTTASAAAQTWTNQGTIAATDSNLGPLQNYAPTVNLAGTFRQSDLGTFTRTPRTTVNLTGTLVGGLTLDDTTGSWNLVDATLRGGTFAVAGSGAARLTAVPLSEFVSATAFLTGGVTLNAPIDLSTARGVRLTVTGGLTLNTTLTVGGPAVGGGVAAVVFGDPTQTLRTDGSGRVVFGGRAGNVIGPAANGTLTIGPGVTVEGDIGTVGGDSSTTLINQGTVRALFTSPTALRTVQIAAGTVRNDGAVVATGGGQLHLRATQNLVNLSGPDVPTTGTGPTTTRTVTAALSGGTWQAESGGRIALFPTVPLGTNTSVRVTRNAAAVVLDGAASGFVNSVDGSDVFAALAENDGAGSFTVRNGRAFFSAPAFTNRGVLTIGANSTNVGGTSFTQAAGVFTVDGSFTPPGGTLRVNGGVLKGVGTVQGNVVNAGTVAPGNSPGFLRVVGNFTQTPSGVLDLEIAGRDPNVPQYDRVQVTGNAAISGTVRETLLDGFEPAPGDLFTVVTAASVSLDPALVYQLPAPGGAQRELAPVVAANKLSLEARRVPPIKFGAATTLAGVFSSTIVSPQDVAVDGAGNTYVVGYYTDTAADVDREAGDGFELPVDNEGGFVAKYDPDGKSLWAFPLTASGRARAVSLALDPGTNPDPAVTSDDRVYVAGTTNGATLSYAGGPTVSGLGLFFLRVNEAGAQQALTGLGFGLQPDRNGRYGLAARPGGNVFFGGGIVATVDVDPGPGTVFPTSLSKAVVVEYTPDFGYVRNRVFGDGSGAAVGEIAVDRDGLVWAAGSFAGTLTVFGSGNPVSAGGQDVLLLKLQGIGAGFDVLAVRTYGAEGNDIPSGLAVGPDNGVVLGGAFRFAVDFDPDPAESFTLVSGGDTDAFVLKLTSDAEFLWARAAGGFRPDDLDGLAIDGLGNIYSTGSFTDTVDFDPGDGTFLLSAGTGAPAQGYVQKLDPAGKFVWAAQLGARPGADVEPAAVAVGPAGRVASVGRFRGEADFDPTPTAPSPGVRTFTASFNPTYNISGTAGYVSLLSQKALPVVTVAGLPAGAVEQGTTLSAAAVVEDLDSSYFTYGWAVQRGGEAPQVGTGPVFGTVPLKPGRYTFTVVVTDESGNSTTVSRVVPVVNAPPRLNPVAYADPAALPAGGVAAGARGGWTLAAGGGYTLAGALPASGVGGTVKVYDAAGAFVRTLGPESGAADRFGAAVAVVGGYAAVGAPNDVSGLGGTVYVYRLSDGVRVQTIRGPGPAVAGNGFGASVAAFGELLLVGAPNRQTAAGTAVGEAYLVDPATGRLAATYANPAATPNDRFGEAVATVGGLVLVGSPGSDAAGADAGAVVVFDPTTGRVVRTLANPAPGAAGGGFGSVLAAAGLRAAVGAPFEAGSAGAVSVFDLDPASVTFGRLILGLRTPAGGTGFFGYALAGSGNRLLVGAPGGPGTAYVFDVDPGSPAFGGVVQAVRKAVPAGGDGFGASVAFQGRDVLAGVPFDDTAAADGGRVYRAAAGALVARTSATTDEGGLVTVSGSFSDPGPADHHTAVLDWGTGDYTRVRLAAGTNFFTATYLYADDDPSGTAQDPYDLRVRVLDDIPDVAVVDRDPAGPDPVARFDGTVGAAVGRVVADGGSGVAGATDVSGAVVGPDELLYVAYQGGGNPVVRFDPATGERVGTFVAAGPPRAPRANRHANVLAFGPDGTLYIADDPGRRVRRYDGRTGEALPDGPATGVFGAAPAAFGAGPFELYGLAFGPDGTLYLAYFAFGESKVGRFDPATGALLGVVATFPEFGTGVYGGPAFAPDGTFFVLADLQPNEGFLDAAVQVDPATGEKVRPVVLGNNHFDNDLLVGPDGSLLYADSVGRRVTRYDLATGEFAGELVTPADGLVNPTLLFQVRPQDATAPVQTVRNVAPAVTVRTATAAGGTFTLAAEVSDPGVRDTLGYLWEVTAGTVTGPATGSGRTFTFTPSGPVTVRLAVTDDDGGTTTFTSRVVVGTAATDAISLSNTAATVNGVSTNYGTVDKVVVYGLAGNDTISAAGMTAAAGLPVELVGGNGADTLTGGPKDDVLTGNSPGDYAAGTDDRAADSLLAGAGNDTLDGGLGNDFAGGQDGDDRYQTRPGSDDVLSEEGFGGTDTVDYGIAAFGITFALDRRNVRQVVNPAAPPTGQHTVEIRGPFENLDGSPFGDVLSGDDGNNAIDGGGGNDDVYGGIKPPAGAPLPVTGGGRDTLAGGRGNDTVRGGAGNDVIFGGRRLPPGVPVGLIDPDDPTDPDDDLIEGGLGDDDIDGGRGDDEVYGGIKPTGGTVTVPVGSAERNTLSGGRGNDTVRGGSGNDVIYGAFRPESGLAGLVLPAGTDDDLLEGGPGEDLIDAGDGDDEVYGGLKPPAGTTTVPTPTGERNTLVGGRGNDTVRGGSGNDVIFGGNRYADLPALAGAIPDNDFLEGGDGDDDIDAGDGDDEVYGGLKPAAGTTAPPARDTLVGGRGNDTVRGGSGNDVIYGGQKDDAQYAGPDDNLIEGGGGDDAITGGAGNDDIYAGLKPVGGTTTVTTGRPTIAGGAGNDTIRGGAGNDVIYGGYQPTLLGAAANDVAIGGARQIGVRALASDDDLLEGGAGADFLDGGAGNDDIYGGLKPVAGTPTAPLGAGDQDTLRGGRGNDTIRGGAGNDVIYGEDGADVLSGEDGTDAVDGGSGDDVIAEQADADLILTATTIIVGGLQEAFYDIEGAVLAGGPGNNRLLADGAGGAAGPAFAGPVALYGLGGNDTLVGTAFADSLFGGSGNDTLVGLAGADTLDTGSGTDAADGGVDNDLYLVPMSGRVSVQDAGGIDGVDVSAAAFAVNANLISGFVADAGGNLVTFPAGVIENLTGTGFNDTLFGSDERNILSGGGGADAIEGTAGEDTLRGGFLQVVYLDFDSATGPNEYRYTIEDRNRIQARLQALYAAPFTVTFTQAAPATGRYATVVLNAGGTGESEALVAGRAAEVDGRNLNPTAGAVINVNGFLGRPGQPAASPDNYVALTAGITAHELAHLFGLRHTDAFGPIGIDPLTGQPYGVNPGVYEAATDRETVAGRPAGTGAAVEYGLRRGLIQLTPRAAGYEFVAPQGTVYDGEAAVATFTVAATGGVTVTTLGAPARRVLSAAFDRGGNDADGKLTLTWSARPAASAVDIVYQYSPTRPEFPGQVRANETTRHVMASPASVGSTIEDVLAGTFFGERELIKLAVADVGAVRREADLPPPVSFFGGPPAGVAARLGPGRQVRDLGTLPQLAVPNLLPTGTGPDGRPLAVNAGKGLAVRAATVVGRVDLNTATGLSESDVYSFDGQGGELLSAELFSATLDERIPDFFDGVIRVYDPSGLLVAYYGGTAVGDDGVDNQDPVLQDVVLPATGRYYVEVDTYTRSGVPDDAAGGYELMLTTYANPVAGGAVTGVGGGDTLSGGLGLDTVTGSVAGDLYVDDTALDTRLNFTPGLDQRVTSVNRRPTAVVRISPQAVPPSDDTPVILTAVVDTFDTDDDFVNLNYRWTIDGRTVFQFGPTLSAALSAGQVVTVRVVPSDAGGNGEPAIDTVVVGQGVPVATGSSLTALEDTPTAGKLALTDAAGNPVTPVLAQAPAHGTLRFDATGLGFVYTPFPNYTGTDSFRYAGSNRVGFGNAATVSITVAAVNDAPSFAAGPDVTAAEDGGPRTVAGWATAVSAGPANEAGQGLTFEVTTDKPGLFAAGPAVSAAGVLTFTPAANAFGTATVTVRLRDNGGTTNGGVDLSEARTFTITVTPVNDAPTVPDGGFAATEDNPFTGQLGGADVDGDPLTYAVVTRPTRGTLSLDAATGLFTYTPNGAVSGPDSFTYRASDGRLESNLGTATINVAAVNDAPTFTAGGNVAVLEDAAAYTAAWATNITTGPGDGAQALAFDVTTDRPDLFAVLPAVGAATGKLSFTPAADANGVATVTVVLKDDGGTANGGADTSDARTFTITLTAVNDAPVFTKGADRDVASDAGPQTAPGWATGVAAGPPDESGQTVAFTVVADRPELFTVVPAVNPVGTLTFTPKPGADGTATVTVVLKDDGGTANGGADTSAAQTFTIRVRSGVVVNRPPAATVALDTASPRTFDALTATATTSDPDDDPVTLTFVWKVNGTVVRTTANTAALTDALDLSVAGNGDAGDVVTVEVTPDDGRQSGPTVSASATVEDTPPAAPVITGVSDDTGTSPSDGVTKDNTLAVSGTGTPGTTVTLYRDGTKVGTAAVDPSGGWSFDGTGTALADGPYTFTAAAAYPQGAFGAESAPFAVVVDTVAPTATFERLDPSPTTAAAVRYRVTFPSAVFGLAAGNFAVDATGPAGAKVTEVVGEGTTWTVTVGTGTGDGTLALRLADGAGATDAAGNPVAAPATGPAYSVDRTAPQVVKFEVLYGNGRAYDLATASRLNLPWTITGVRVTFTEPVAGALGSLGLTGRGGALAVSGLAGSGTDTLTWTPSSPITLDAVTAALVRTGGDAVTDAAGNTVAAGKDSFAFSVVLGDVSGDKKVNSTDLSVFAAVQKAGRTDARYLFCDLDGDGDVDSDDLGILKKRVGTGLP